MALANFALVTGSAAAAGGPVKFNTVSFSGDSSYATGGNTGFKAGLQTLTSDGRAPVVLLQVGSGGDYALEYVPSTDKLLVKVASTGAEVGNGTNLSAVTFKVLAISV